MNGVFGALFFFSLSLLLNFFFWKPVDFIPSSTVCVCVCVAVGARFQVKDSLHLFLVFSTSFPSFFFPSYSAPWCSQTRERESESCLFTLSSYLYITHVSIFFRDFDIFSTTYKGKVCSPIGETASRSCQVFSLVLAFGCAHARALPFWVRVFCATRDQIYVQLLAPAVYSLTKHSNIHNGEEEKKRSGAAGTSCCAHVFFLWSVLSPVFF